MKKQINSIKFILVLTLMFLPHAILNSASFAGKNILFITLDTTRSDHLGCYNASVNFTPNIDKLARDGILFTDCYSAVPLTLPSHSTIFTGKYPVTINVRNNGRYFLTKEHTTLAELFKKKGYYTFAVISSYVLVSKFGLSQGFLNYDDSLDATGKMSDYKSEISAGKVYNKFKLILNNIKSKKFFGWLHLYDPHIPYSPPGKYRKKFRRDLYSGEIAYMDEIIGKIINELKKKNIYKNTVIVIAGDHGEDRGEHKELGHGIFCYNVSLKVPLIISNLTQKDKGKKISGIVSLLDIFPTISEIFKLGSVSGVEGKSLFGDANRYKEGMRRTIFFESLHGKEEMGWAPLTGLIKGKYKYISLPDPELYDLNKDPGERSNIFKSKFRLSKKLDSELERFYKTKAVSGLKGKRNLSKKDIKNLATLGYISSFKKTKKSIDPKTGIKYIDKLRTVQSEIDNGKLNEAEKLLKKLFFSPLRIKTIHAFKLFDLIYRRKGDLKNLIKFQELALKDFPKNENIKLLLAKSYFNSFKLKDSQRMCMNILESNPKNTQALIQLGKIYLNLKKPDLSIATFKKASLIEPGNIGIKKDIALIYLKIGRKQEASAILDRITSNKLILKNPDNIKLMADISNLYFRSGRKEKAELLLLNIFSDMRSSYQLATEIGRFYFKIRRPDKAELYYSKALELNKNYAPAYNGLGVLNLALSGNGRNRGRLGKAFNYFEKAIKLNSTYSEALNGRGTSYIFMGKFQNAVIDLEKALKINPGLIDTYFNLGIIYLRLNNNQRANQLFKRCKDLFYRQLNRNQKERLTRLINETEPGNNRP